MPFSFSWRNLLINQLTTTPHGRQKPASRLRLEKLEDRIALAVSPTFVNDNWHLISDNDSNGLDQGDDVRNDNDTINPGSIVAAYGVNAFGVVTTGSVIGSNASYDSINDAIANTTSGGTVQVLEGSYSESVSIAQPLTLSGAVDVANNPASTLNLLGSGLLVSVNTVGTVTVENFNFVGTDSINQTGMHVGGTANLGTLIVQNSDFQHFGTLAIAINGDPANNGRPLADVQLSDLTFSNNGSSGVGGAGDITFFQYNGDASLTDITLVGSAGSSTGARSALQFRGIGAGTGLFEAPMGTVSLDDIDISGTYRTQFLGIQRYSDVSGLSLNDVALGGAGSAITGTFGAALRLDAVGTGSPSSPAAVDLGNTYFRGLDSYVPAFDIEFAPDNTFAFLRADATGTRWNTSAGTDIAAGDLTLAELFEVEDRIVHYVEPDHPTHTKPFKGFAEITPGDAYITGTFSSLINRGIEMAAAGGTVHIAAGTYNQNVAVNKSVTLDGAGDGSSPAANTVIAAAGDIVAVSADDVTIRDLRMTGGNRGIIVTGTRENLSILSSTLANNSVGFRMGTLDSLDGLTITDSTFEGNSLQGIVVFTDANGTSYLTDVVISDTTFVNNGQKGAYFEKLNDALFDDITVLDSGTDPAYAFNNGIDINLKHADYANITIQNSLFSGSGVHTIDGPGGLDFAAALAIKARDDAPSYNSNPATLTNVLVRGNVFADSAANDMTTAIRLGEPGKNNAGPTGVVICGNDLSDRTFVGVDNTTASAVDAAFNWWGTTDGAEIDADLALGDVDFTPWLLASISSPDQLIFEDASSGAALIVNTSTGEFLFVDDSGQTYSGTGARLQNGKLKIHEHAGGKKIDVTASVSGNSLDTIEVALKGKGKPVTFTLDEVVLPHC